MSVYGEGWAYEEAFWARFRKAERQHLDIPREWDKPEEESDEYIDI